MISKFGGLLKSEIPFKCCGLVKRAWLISLFWKELKIMSTFNLIIRLSKGVVALVVLLFATLMVEAKDVDYVLDFEKNGNARFV